MRNGIGVDKMLLEPGLDRGFDLVDLMHRGFDLVARGHITQGNPRACSGGIASTLLTTRRNRLAISTTVALMAGPDLPLKTRRTGSALPPIPSG